MAGLFLLASILAGATWLTVRKPWKGKRARQVYVYENRPKVPIPRTTAVTGGIAGAQWLLMSWLGGSVAALVVLGVPAFYAAKALVAPNVRGQRLSGIYLSGDGR